MPQQANDEFAFLSGSQGQGLRLQPEGCFRFASQTPEAPAGGPEENG